MTKPHFDHNLALRAQLFTNGQDVHKANNLLCAYQEWWKIAETDAEIAHVLSAEQSLRVFVNVATVRKMAEKAGIMPGD